MSKAAFGKLTLTDRACNFTSPFSDNLGILHASSRPNNTTKDDAAVAVWNNVDGGDREYSGGGGVVGGMIIIMRLLGRSVGRSVEASPWIG